MRLSKIKLAGFKSFVDPTTFQLPSNLVGIVGPNGCGKSNVIDAVRWVMGEMSAKHLRGDSMADVIFNGSASRKPVGTASIELFFDNSDGSIGGQYAQYAEISLRRLLARDGTSSYFLNNVRCRRKDITDLFLGTGLGSRSYAIIEQGMVSRLVEARPDEMRTYIEEAAGISKYKERRKETESRIQHTRDNLARLTDLREEIAKQIEYLNKQAKTAERYQEMKSRERRLEAELLALRLAEIDKALETARVEYVRRQKEFDAAIAEQRHIETAIVSAREGHIAATEAFSRVQGQHYAIQGEISRLEQAIAHTKEIRERQAAELGRSQDQLATVGSEGERDRSRLQELDSSIALLLPRLQSAEQDELVARDLLREAEHGLEQWQTSWHDFSIELKERQQHAELEQARSEHLAAQLAQVSRQEESLLADRAGINLDTLRSRLDAQYAGEASTAERARILQARLDEIEREAEETRGFERHCGAELEIVNADLASHKGQLVALRAVQETALGADDEALTGWLSPRNLRDRPRLAQQLRVDPAWLVAVETVLGDFLQAVCVDNCTALLSELPDAQLVMVEPNGSPVAPISRSLLSHVGEAGHAASLLGSVLVADNLNDALQVQQQLMPGQSVVTQDGLWLGRGWIRINRGQRSKAGILAREHQLRDLEAVVRRLERESEALESRRSQARHRLAELGPLRASAIGDFNSANREHAEAIAVLDNCRAEISRAEHRLAILDGDLARLAQDSAQLRTAFNETQQRMVLAREQIELVLSRRPALQKSQEDCLSLYSERRAEAERSAAAVAQFRVEFEGARVSRESVQASLLRLDFRCNELLDRASFLQQEIEKAEPEIEHQQAALAGQLERQIQTERELSARRTDLEGLESQLRENDSRRIMAEKTANTIREQVDLVRLQVREAEIRRESLLDNFAATGADFAETRSGLAADADLGVWQQALDDIRRKIERLGPINLAAIEQYNEQSERKKYLDAQNADLMAALETLEQAIRKIDRETRTRFQETFETINRGLKRIFPRLFGGGHAYLSLEGEDILSAGVTVMARPPGKRNSHIHLLSGGEKALTAVALIFAIFELNPAPFCLLDEVDAPLDEANVARFCDIVKEMSQRVQFVVITHNKTTMEMAQQLTGVTMNEPGVSRLVTVDLEAAVKLAAS